MSEGLEAGHRHPAECVEMETWVLKSGSVAPGRALPSLPSNLFVFACLHPECIGHGAQTL